MPAKIGETLNISEVEVNDFLEATRQWLYNNVTEQIQTEINLQFQPQGAAKNQIDRQIETRLTTILQQL